MIGCDGTDSSIKTANSNDSSVSSSSGSALAGGIGPSGVKFSDATE